jgi:hypothetical protein
MLTISKESHNNPRSNNNRDEKKEEQQEKEDGDVTFSDRLRPGDRGKGKSLPPTLLVLDLDQLDLL